MLATGLLLLLSQPVIAAEAPSFTLTELLPVIDLAAADDPVAYRQTRLSGLLSEPVTTHGTIVYRAPDYLRKTVARPDGQRVVVIDDGWVRLHTGDETHARALERMPGLRALMGILRAIAAGNAEALRQRYEARLVGGRDDWTLHLRGARHRTASRSPGPGNGPAFRRYRSHTRVVLSGGERVERIVLESPAFGEIRITLAGSAD